MTNPIVLIVDDEPDIRQLLSLTLTQLGIDVVEAADVTAAYQKLQQGTYQLCLTDMRLPDGDGLELIDHIQQKYPHLPVAMITAYGNTDIAVEALKRGAFDFVSKPVQLPKLRAMVSAALKLSADQSGADKSQWQFVGSSRAMEDLREQISRVARSQAPIYISGESGSGKEIVARAIHYQGPRSEGPFIPVNCGAIPSELMESEFFGHKKGSFTGAYQDKQGLFQAANGGTLFLDEVADLPLPMQVKLLRGIQEKAIRPLGADAEIPVDVRILSASHKNLSREVELNRFRQDLFYRINVIELHVPSLRERPEDIHELVQLFVGRNASQTDKETPYIEPAAMTALLSHQFPGNVRELENTLERAFTLCDGKTITVADLQLQTMSTPVTEMNTGDASVVVEANDSIPPYTGGNMDSYLEGIEKRLLEEALEATRWNKSAAAEKLGITDRQLRYKLKKLEIE
ncbi:MAG: sigma-54-dependent Fis family transcriptional regulator [Gammaproteobacteria bacterium]|nr:MAG: sigma-54-dependent Fis family transcriptional regulator [Gammaproteobacteria bacterium]RLA54806.1 MAG: sigma-54-dependent Fis family transcriptional regulator [Gammaproteobacteria bacterium]